ncbi:uncharacterized protein K460DRAFT_368385 [Cucurbitaria berberidis CBS 394.84]|uniref:Uncharacterized protein n=1 Tax=Cucurbitaria berberidis CBS 394.84 TaxID=1168544 RepID=A0A9P4GDF3_9PLEO|nr:uncharacterized protein K460DRAFT_368385 [Cucurbitaria berberidis CBS 394.84]KAF1843481.1 hypothetical protein K460DRAFT_368385 [Cucurbitaria berberidis CBS 394.84]
MPTYCKQLSAMFAMCNGTKYAADNAPVRNCGDNNWCCGEKKCCDQPSSIFQLAATAGRSSTTSSSSSLSSHTSSATTTAPPATSSPAQETAATGLSTGAKAGIGVGAAAVVILCILVAVLLIRLKKQKQAEYNSMDKTNIMSSDAPMGVHEQKYGLNTHEREVPLGELLVENGLVELSERQHLVAELESREVPRELSARGGNVEKYT